jgi:hypothetical protein
VSREPGAVHGQITARFADTTLLTQAQNGTAADFAFAFTVSAALTPFFRGAV